MGDTELEKARIERLHAICSERDEWRRRALESESFLRALESRLTDVPYIVSLIQRHPDDSFAAAHEIIAYVRGEG